MSLAHNGGNTRCLEAWDVPLSRGGPTGSAFRWRWISPPPAAALICTVAAALSTAPLGSYLNSACKTLEQLAAASGRRARGREAAAGAAGRPRTSTRKSMYARTHPKLCKCALVRHPTFPLTARLVEGLMGRILFSIKFSWKLEVQQAVACCCSVRLMPDHKKCR